MKLNMKNTIYASLAFGWISIFWFGYDNLIQTINISTFGMRVPVSGAILAIDNILGLIILPLCGWLSDRSKSRFGKRTPFIVLGTLLSMSGFMFVAIFAYTQNRLGYIIALVITLIGMASYRSPALALVPDITPDSLRSKANAVSNIVSALFSLVGIVVVTPFLVEKYVAANNYYPIVIGIVVSTFLTLGFFLWKVRENKMLADLKAYSASVGAYAHNKSNESEEINAESSFHANCDKKTKVRNKILLLFTIFFFYMAYNALVSNFTNYARYVLNYTIYSQPLIVIMIGALFGFVITPKLTKIIGGRKRAIVLGFIIMGVSFTIASLLIFEFVKSVVSIMVADVLMNLCFACAGGGYALVIVNIYPVFLEFSGADRVGEGTGVYSFAMTLAMIITPILAGFFIEKLGEYTGTYYSTEIGSQIIANAGDYRILIPYSLGNLLIGLVMIIFVKTKDSTKRLPKINKQNNVK